MAIKKSAEDYLEAILVLKKQKGVVHSIDVARHLGYSKPSISRAVSNLRQDGLLRMEPDGALLLTDTGLAIAENIYERHTVLTALFQSIGVSDAVAAEDACRVEHAISDETFRCIREMNLRIHSSQPDKTPEDDKKKKRKKKK